MPTPKSKQDLPRLLGIINFLGKFIPNPSIIKTAHGVRRRVALVQSSQCSSNKEILIESPTLRYYDPKLPTKTSVDASKFGLRAVLLQKHDDIWAPVAYAGRSLSKSEQNYAQIEKEALAILFGCERFHVYLYGKSFIVESDHKPLQPIFKNKICSNSTISPASAEI